MHEKFVFCTVHEGKIQHSSLKQTTQRIWSTGKMHWFCLHWYLFTISCVFMHGIALDSAYGCMSTVQNSGFIVFSFFSWKESLLQSLEEWIFKYWLSDQSILGIFQKFFYFTSIPYPLNLSQRYTHNAICIIQFHPIQPFYYLQSKYFLVI